jgi:uncharacterized membrane protein YqjE
VNFNNIDISTYKSIKTKINLDVVDIENKENRNIQRKAFVGIALALIYLWIYFSLLCTSNERSH